MRIAHSIIGGLAGAVALNILHQSVAQFYHDAPRVDLVGEEALNKGLTATGAEPLKGNTLFGATLAGDIFSNTLYFSLIGTGSRKNLLPLGAGLGVLAGIGALALTEPMGLDDTPITKTNSTKALTVAWYTIGGLVAACTIRALSK